MNLVRLLGFTTLTCGCVVGRYRDLHTQQDVAYVEEKGVSCEDITHRRNHTVRMTVGVPESGSWRKLKG